MKGNEMFPESGNRGHDEEGESGGEENKLDEALSAVKLKEGLEISQLCSEMGANFEISEDNMDTMPDVNDYFSDEVFKYAKMELVGGESSDSDEEDNVKSTQASLTPFQKMAVRMKDISPDGSGGVLKEVIMAGTGELPPEGAFVTVHYNAYQELVAEPFDSTPLRGRKLRFRLGSGKVINGLDIGICTMRAEEKAHFLVKPDFAYGKMGCPPRIPENATVLFEVELFSFLDNKAMVDFSALSVEEKNETNFATLLKVCYETRITGNDHFQQKQWDKAIEKYTSAINLLERRDLANEEEEQKCNELLLPLYQNIALAYEKVKKYKKVKVFCEAALELDENSTKSLVRLGRAQIIMGDYESARAHLLKALQHKPHESAIHDELKKLEETQRKFKAKEKEFCSRMFPSSTQEVSALISAATASKEKRPELYVSDEFQNLVYDQLNNFLESEDEELCLPGGLSPSEHACVAATAKVLGLSLHHLARPGSLIIKVVKLSKKV